MKSCFIAVFLTAALLLVFEAQAQVELVLVKDSTQTAIDSRFRGFYCSDSVWVGFSETDYNLYTSTDYGNTWIRRTRSPQFGGFAVSRNIFYSGGALDAFASLNLGQSWFKIGSPFEGYDTYTRYEGLGISTKNDSMYIVRKKAYYQAPPNQGNVYFHGIDAKTGATRDYGLIARNFGTNSRQMYSITGATFVILSYSILLRIEHDSKIITTCSLDTIDVSPESILETSKGTMLVGTRKGLFKSLDKGLKWSKIATPLEPNIIRTLAQKGDRIFAGLWPTGEIWSSDNDDMTWNRLRLPTFKSIYQINVSGDFLTILANDSLWRVPLASLSTLGLSHAANTIALSCSPNPVSNTALLKCTMKENGFVTIEIVDVLGRVVETVLQGVVPAGAREYSVSTANLPNGVYQIILRSESSFATQRMTVMK